VAFGDGFANSGGNQFRRPRMTAVRFYYDRISRHHRRSRIATGNGKRERKIARAEHDHRANGNEHAADVRFGDWLSLGNCVIYPRVDPGAFAGDLGKEFELVDRASAFTSQASFRQAGLLVRTGNESIPQSNDFISDVLQKNSALLAGGFTKGLKSSCCQLKRRIDFLVTRKKKRWLQGGSVEGAVGLECGSSAQTQLVPDKAAAMHVHK